MVCALENKKESLLRLNSYKMTKIEVALKLTVKIKTPFYVDKYCQNEETSSLVIASCDVQQIVDHPLQGRYRQQDFQPVHVCLPKETVSYLSTL